jgi:hypothetical protein
MLSVKHDPLHRRVYQDEARLEATNLRGTLGI